MTRIAYMIIWASLLTVLFIPLGAHAVKKDNLYLFSAVKGRIVKNGEPVTGLKVERSTFWNMEKEPRLETTYTDGQGFYSFPEMTGSAEFGFLAKLFHNPTVLQTIYVYETQDKIQLYTNIKNNYDKIKTNKEFGLFLQSDLIDKKPVVNNLFKVNSKLLEN